MPSPRLLLFVPVLIAGGRVASAQTDPTMPVDPYAAPAPEAALPEPEPEPAPVPWDPLDDDGWPVGISLESMRHLRKCGLAEQLPGPGEVIPCRPEVIAEVPQWQFAADWTTGIAAGDLPMTGGAHAFGVELGFGLTRSLSIGPRYEMMGFGLPGPDDMLNIGVSHRLLVNARKRFFTDEADRDAISVGVGGGYAFQEPEIGGGTPIVRASIGREVGMYLDDENAVGMGLELAYERNLDDAQLSAIVAAARFGFEINIREPENLGSMDEPPSTAYSAAGDIYLGIALGLGYTVGVPITNNLELASTASFIFGKTDFGEQSGLDGAQWAAASGPRVGLGWPSPAPLYVQVQGGAMWVSTENGGEVAPIVDTEFGISPMFSCDGRIDLAVHLRTEVEDDASVLWGGAVLRIAFGPGHRGAFRSCRGGHGSPPIVTMPTPPPPPPEPTPVPEPTPPPTDTVVIDGSAGGGGTVEGEVRGDVTVEVEPVVIEVELGASFLGGAVQIRIDPRILPLAQLRAAGHIEVEITGPSEALGGYEAGLRTVFDREGLRADGWFTTATNDSVIRARFTLK